MKVVLLQNENNCADRENWSLKGSPVSLTGLEKELSNERIVRGAQLCRGGLEVFLGVIIGSHFVVREELLVHLLLHDVLIVSSLLPDHPTGVTGISIGSTAPCCLFGKR